MKRRRLLAVLAVGSLAGCADVLGDDGEQDESVDTDGDGMLDEQDYAPRDPDVQSKDDLTTPPTVHSAGVLEVRQTFRADLDSGREVNDDRIDFFFEAESETERYLTPEGDAVFALGGTQPVGRQGCEDASLESERIHVDDLEGRYVCAQTGEGRYAELFVDEVTPHPGVMKIAYTTWSE